MAQGRDFTNQFAAARCVFYDQNGKNWVENHQPVSRVVGSLEFEQKTYWCVLRREFSEMIPVITSNNHPSNPQQPPATRPFPTFSTSKKSKVEITPKDTIFLACFFWIFLWNQLRDCGSSPLTNSDFVVAGLLPWKPTCNMLNINTTWTKHRFSYCP